MYVNVQSGGVNRNSSQVGLRNGGKGEKMKRAEGAKKFMVRSTCEEDIRGANLRKATCEGPARRAICMVAVLDGAQNIDKTIARAAPPTAPKPTFALHP